jgi:hypothetical protein
MQAARDCRADAPCRARDQSRPALQILLHGSAEF